MKWSLADLHYINQEIAQSPYKNETGEIALYMDRIINATLDKGAAQICGDLGMVISAEGIVMTNYTLEDFCANLSIEARPKFA